MTRRGFRVRGLGEVAIRVRDMGRMVAFYRDVIGLEILSGSHRSSITFFRLADGFDGHTAILALFEPDAGREGLHPKGTPVPGGSQSTLHHIALNVPRDEQDAVIRWYEAQGLRYRLEEFTWIGWRGVFTEDPEGNTVELVSYDASLLDAPPEQAGA